MLTLFRDGYSEMSSLLSQIALFQCYCILTKILAWIFSPSHLNIKRQEQKFSCLQANISYRWTGILIEQMAPFTVIHKSEPYVLRSCYLFILSINLFKWLLFKRNVLHVGAEYYRVDDSSQCTWQLFPVLISSGFKNKKRPVAMCQNSRKLHWLMD